MSTRRILGAAALLAIGGLSLGLTACFDNGRCDFYANGKCASPTGSGGSTGSMTSGSMTSGSMTSSTGSVSAMCDPEKLPTGMAIASTCGLFVKPGIPTGGDGTQGMPFGKLADALQNNPNALPIYVCATNSQVNETITLTKSEVLYGGVDCATWIRSSSKTAWTTKANEIPLTLANTTGALVDGFAITSQTATGVVATTRDGNSSIGVFANAATATLANTDVTANNGADGVAGMDVAVAQAPGDQSAPASFDGNKGGGCAAASGAGGPAKDYSMCPTQMGTVTEGGKGGDGALVSGSDGGDGFPIPTMGTPNGAHGDGEGTVANPGLCTQGTPGHPGTPGMKGLGGSGAGSLDSKSYRGAPGTAGGNGSLGQGGGGGGGAKGSGAHGCAVGATGPSGGSGGAGGCGGVGAEGGGAGGGSIALASYNSMLTLTNVTLHANAGGSGQKGGIGQQGGQGGQAAPSLGAACKGGDGGPGGSGGSGGGGKGGPSFGIAYSGNPPSGVSTTTIVVSSTASQGGPASLGDVPGDAGPQGDTKQTQSF